jgi:hypothetical protein
VPKGPRIPYLLRKSRGGRDVPVLKEEDFPVPFMTDGKSYEIRRTKSGGIVMVKAE